MSNKKYIFLNGEKFEVSKEVYKVYHRSRRYEEYFMYEKKTGKIIIEGEKVTFKDSLEVSIQKLEQEGIELKHNYNLEEDVLLKEKINTVHNALSKLTDEEYQIIKELFFYRRTEREVAKTLNCSNVNLHKKKKKILKKLKNKLIKIIEL